MCTPLQDRSYELLIRVASSDVAAGSNERARQIAKHLFEATLEVSSSIELATAAPNRTEFRLLLSKAHGALKSMKLWLRLLDDLGRIEPESAYPMSTVAEEVHRLLLAALHTSTPMREQEQKGRDCL